MHSSRQKTLVFCTAYAMPQHGAWHDWDQRYRSWLNAIRLSSLEHDQILIVDDGSDVLPDWPDTVIVRDTDATGSDAPVVLYHFTQHLGRRSVSDFPGWVRSFFFAAKYAAANGFTKIVHIESDAFLISRRCLAYFNEFSEGWAALWCLRWARPESGIQIIAGEAIKTYLRLAERDTESYAGVVIEDDLPFTFVNKELRGDRYGEYQAHVPLDADYSMQSDPSASGNDPDYYWWTLNRTGQYQSEDPTKLEYFVKAGDGAGSHGHPGLYYQQFLHLLDGLLQPRHFFEVGSSGGETLRSVRCDVVCVDPNLEIVAGMLGVRKRSLLFRCDSDAFFAENDLTLLAPPGPDLAFLDGLHHFEALLRDFINTERHCQPASTILLHDCLPLNARMAERVFRTDPDEDAATRDFWTGDVWKLLPVLQRYRPDLRIACFDCSPTGLVACTDLDPASTVLADNYAAIVGQYAELDLGGFGFDRLWKLFPLVDTIRLRGESAQLRSMYDPRRAVPRRKLPALRSVVAAQPVEQAAMPVAAPGFSSLENTLRLAEQRVADAAAAEVGKPRRSGWLPWSRR